MNLLNQILDINNLKTLKGLALQDILTQVHLYVHRSKTWFFCLILVNLLKAVIC